MRPDRRDLTDGDVTNRCGKRSGAAARYERMNANTPPLRRPEPLGVAHNARSRDTAPADVEEETEMSPDVRIKRIYDPPHPDDGYRVLIDHVWPRGVSRERARLDEWAPTLAPSGELRKWFDHRPPRFQSFRARYRAELAAQSELLDELRRRAACGRVTVLYAARDREHNNAVVLAELLRAGPGGSLSVPKNTSALNRRHSNSTACPRGVRKRPEVSGAPT